MRITLAALLLCACAPVAAAPDAALSDVPLPWAVCEGCGITCSTTSEAVCGGPAGVDCEGCEPRCGQALFNPEPAEAVTCETPPGLTASYECGGLTTGYPTPWLCYRPTF